MMLITKLIFNFLSHGLLYIPVSLIIQTENDIDDFL